MQNFFLGIRFMQTLKKDNHFFYTFQWIIAFSVKSKLIISPFQTVKSLSTSMFQKKKEFSWNKFI